MTLIGPDLLLLTYYHNHTSSHQHMNHTHAWIRLEVKIQKVHAKGQNEDKMKEVTYFVNKRSKTVVERLDLLFLISPNGLDVWVNPQVQRCQKTFIDLYSCNWRAENRTGAPTFPRNHP